MSVYEFTLTFSLPQKQGGGENPEQYTDALYEAGCDDALIGNGTHGSITLDFMRESAAAEEAVSTAIDNVKTAIPGAELNEVKPDLVGVSAIAKLLNCSRQNVQKHVTSDPFDFPVPAYTGRSPLWHLAEIASWILGEQNQIKMTLDEEIYEISKVAFKLNINVQKSRLERNTNYR